MHWKNSERRQINTCSRTVELSQGECSDLYVLIEYFSACDLSIENCSSGLTHIGHARWTRTLVFFLRFFSKQQHRSTNASCFELSSSWGNKTTVMRICVEDKAYEINIFVTDIHFHSADKERGYLYTYVYVILLQTKQATFLLLIWIVLFHSCTNRQSRVQQIKSIVNTNFRLAQYKWKKSSSLHKSHIIRLRFCSQSNRIF